jgi:uncharacterized membrane protein
MHTFIYLAKRDRASLPVALDFPAEKQPDYWDFLDFSLEDV